MSSKTEICNLAISHLGSSKRVANIESERSNEANTCRVFYDVARQSTLRDFPWPFANVFATLALVEEDPTDEWAFSYRYPSDCLQFIRILSGSRNDTRQSRVPTKIGKDGQGKLIYSDTEDAECEYTVDVDDPSFYDADFIIAFSLRLAVLIAPAITGADPFKMGERAAQLYTFEISKAKAASGNESQTEEPPQSEFVNARD